jgi:hypothetical protein
MRGLSGSPIFVRGNILVKDVKATSRTKHRAYWPKADIFLLGLWQGSWDATPDEALAADRGSLIRVAIGMGAVVPAEKIIEILNIDALREQRAKMDKLTAREPQSS